MLGNIAARRARIRAYSLDFLQPAFAKHHPRYALRFEECARELKRLFEIALYLECPAEITSLAVDGLLGTFVEADAEYGAFCEAVYGEYLQRVPAPEGYEPGGAYARTLYRLYEELFIAVPEIWLEDVPIDVSD
jgi:hypothetical protein